MTSDLRTLREALTDQWAMWMAGRCDWDAVIARSRALVAALDRQRDIEVSLNPVPSEPSPAPVCRFHDMKLRAVCSKCGREAPVTITDEWVHKPQMQQDMADLRRAHEEMAERVRRYEQGEPPSKAWALEIQKERNDLENRIGMAIAWLHGHKWGRSEHHSTWSSDDCLRILEGGGRDKEGATGE